MSTSAPANLDLERHKFDLDAEIRRGELTLKEQQYADSLRVKNRLWASATAILPLVAALVAAFLGYRQYLGNIKATAQLSADSAHRTAVLNAETERFKAILNAKKDFFARQDTVFQAVLENTSELAKEVERFEASTDGKGNIAKDPKYQALLSQFERFHTADCAAVETEDICEAMNLYWEGLTYAEYLTDPERDHNERVGQFKVVSDDYASIYRPFRTSDPESPDALPMDPADLLWDIQIQLAYRVGDTMTRRQNPSEYDVSWKDEEPTTVTARNAVKK